MNLAYACYWHTHGTPFYATTTQGVMNEINTRVPCVVRVVRVLHIFHSIAHLLHAVLALGSAPCNMESSMFVTPVITRVVHVSSRVEVWDNEVHYA